MTQEDRVVGVEELQQDYADLAELAVIFNHEVVEKGKVWRWKTNGLVRHLLDGECPFYKGDSHVGVSRIRGTVDLNALWGDFSQKLFSLEELMKFYMGMGYSLCGFVEVFGQHQAGEYDLPNLLPNLPPQEVEPEDLIEYVIRKHKGQVLKSL